MKLAVSRGQRARRVWALGLVIGLVAPASGWAHDSQAPRAHRQFNVTTQGPPWPPSTCTDVNGDFIVVGSVLTEVQPGVIVPVPNQAALVSKNTRPPLTNGVEDFSNPLAAPYQVIRPLDLRRGSRDLNLVLYAPSFGPTEGAFGGGPRIPMEGDSPYNLNMVGHPCVELFPGSSQTSYKRPTYPLHRYPILGFQGDQVAYDVNSGDPYDPQTRSGAGCGAGCPGENMLDRRRDEPITLGEWLKARGEIDIRLTRFSRRAGGFTAARVAISFTRLLPHSVYTAWGIRQNVLTGGRMPGPLALPGTFITDGEGKGSLSVEVSNPFPARGSDAAGMRLVAFEISYHPDYQNWGACPERWGVGYRAMSWFDFRPDGSRDLEHLITVPARPRSESGAAEE